MSNPDLYILNKLSQGVKILDKEYFVAWDCENSNAVITYTQEGVEDLQQLSFSDDSEMNFPTELDAHRYLTGLRYLVQNEFDANGWRNLK